MKGIFGLFRQALHEAKRARIEGERKERLRRVLLEDPLSDESFNLIVGIAEQHGYNFKLFRSDGSRVEFEKVFTKDNVQDVVSGVW